MWLIFAQATGTTERFEYEAVQESLPVEITPLDYLWALTTGWMSLLYLPFLIWMMYYCVRNDPGRFLWLWIILLTQPFGPFIYFIARWLPSSQVKLPAFTHRWTKGRELRILETATLQIGNAHQFVQYGEALRKAGLKEKGLAAFLKALEKEPDNLAALWGAASLEYQLDQYELAKEKLEKILKVDESYKFGDVSHLYGKSLAGLHQNEQALAHLEKHAKKWRQPEAMYLLAKLQIENNQKEAARQTLQSIIVDLDSSPKAIARKHLFWRSRAKRLLRKTSG
ncbi:tetratricopeptide repeat protein [Thalassoglobus sp.]|uniref:tetratricopeptide repeat protein n=1 Tax=Thalassoglobus sp. TaxID=2795869 RepID=UPI003AA843DC